MGGRDSGGLLANRRQSMNACLISEEKAVFACRGESQILY